MSDWARRAVAVGREACVLSSLCSFDSEQNGRMRSLGERLGCMDPPTWAGGGGGTLPSTGVEMAVGSIHCLVFVSGVAGV